MLSQTVKLVLALCLASFGTASNTRTNDQLPLTNEKNTKILEPPDRVYGTNNATYGPVPEAKQLFEIEFLEIAPSPFTVDQVVFVWLRGEIPLHPEGSNPVSDTDLANAILKITTLADHPNGESEEPQTYKIPFQTMAYNDHAHLSIRDATGAHVDFMTTGGANDVLLDMRIFGDFIRAGDWTFAIATELEDGRTLFALMLTQYLGGSLRAS